MASREASRLNFARLPDALFMCCYYGVYPWRWLLPRSTKTAATVLVQVHDVRRLRVRRALPIYLPQLLLTGRIFCRAHRLSRTRRLKEQAAFYLCGKFEERSPASLVSYSR